MPRYSNCMSCRLPKVSRIWKFRISIVLYLVLFVAEITVGLRARSVALQADAFHVLSDCISFIVALVAETLSTRKTKHKDLSFGYQKAKSLGAFFNGSYLVALGISMLGTSIERFIDAEEVVDPRNVLIMSCVGLGLNMFSLAILHEHDGHIHASTAADVEADGLTHTDTLTSFSSGSTLKVDDNAIEIVDRSPTPPSTIIISQAHNQCKEHHHKDHNLTGAILHVLCDTLNNIAVIIASAVIWLCPNLPTAHLADPIASTLISLILILSSYKLLRNSGKLLLLSHPLGLDITQLRAELLIISGVKGVHELHVFALTQWKSVATVHVSVDLGRTESQEDVYGVMAKEAGRCFHRAGVHSYTIQIESSASPGCTLACQDNCASLRCCS